MTTIMKNGLNVLLVLGLALFAVAGKASAKSDEPFGRMTVDEVQKKLGEKDFHVFDSNTEELFLKHHVPGAPRVSFTEVSEKTLPPNKDATLVFYCGNPKCTASHEAAKRAIKLGYKNVFIMPDGIEGWVKAGKPVEKGNPATAPETR